MNSEYKEHVCVLSCFSHVQFFATPWTVILQAPLSMGFSRQEYWSGLSFQTPGHLPHPGIKPMSPALQADSSPLNHQESPILLQISFLFFVLFFLRRRKKAVLFSYKALLYPRHLIIHKRQTVIYEIVLPPTKGLNIRLCWDLPIIAFIPPSKLLYIYHTSLH